MKVLPVLGTLAEAVEMPPVIKALVAGNAQLTTDVVCVLVKYKPFVETVGDIRRYSKAIDVVGLLA
jgi:UDP-N-acetyl-D-mannosaminuronic acid dehydrogenase